MRNAWTAILPMRRHAPRGFTLIELMVVMVLIAILLTLSLIHI